MKTFTMDCVLTDKAKIFKKVYSDLSGAYKPGGFDRIEKQQTEKWQEILDLEEQINQKWDVLPLLDFTRLIGKYTRALAIAITRDMFERKIV